MVDRDVQLDPGKVYASSLRLGAGTGRSWHDLKERPGDSAAMAELADLEMKSDLETVRISYISVGYNRSIWVLA